MLENCDVIVIFPIYGWFGATRKSDCGRIVCKTYILIKSNLLSYNKSENRTKKSFTRLSQYYFE